METLSMSQNVKKTDKQASGEELIKRTPIEKTPFTIIENENEVFLVMGKYRITGKEYESKEEILKEVIGNHNWELITTVVGIMVEEIANFKNK